jgi:hypothetical protein
MDVSDEATPHATRENGLPLVFVPSWFRGESAECGVSV